MDWTGRVAVVTGGSSGIGRTTAAELSARGVAVVIVGRDEGRLEVARHSMPGPAPVMTAAADLCHEEDVDRLMDAVAARHGHIDLLFANAGVSDAPPLRETTRADVDRLLDTNVRSVFTTIVRALPLMARGGAVVATSSVAEAKGRPADPLYAASKAAVRSLVRTLALDEDVLARGVRVNAVTPGCIATPLTAQDDPDSQAAIDAWVADAVPMGRWGHPEEVAHAVLFLAGDEAAYVTGSEILVDGGLAQT
jgi:NAD(P)-dependent dehydrogenase (short-subunit alcohol dehydrogenase family)